MLPISMFFRDNMLTRGFEDSLVSRDREGWGKVAEKGTHCMEGGTSTRLLMGNVIREA